MITFTSWISICGTTDVIPVTELFTPSPAILLINPALFQNSLKHIIRNRYLSYTGRSFWLDFLFCKHFRWYIFRFGIWFFPQLPLYFQCAVDIVYITVFQPIDLSTPQAHQNCK